MTLGKFFDCFLTLAFVNKLHFACVDFGESVHSCSVGQPNFLNLCSHDLTIIYYFDTH